MIFEDTVKSRLIENFVSIGLRKGDKVFVQSSFKSIGLDKGSPKDVIDVLQEVIGEKGLLVVPTFTYSVSNIDQDGKELTQPFNRKKSGSKTGIISKMLLEGDGIFRSNHPSHSVAAKGIYAEQLVEGHNAGKTAFGEDTPLHRFSNLDGKVLLLGVGHNRSSIIHVAEFLVDVPYLYCKASGTDQYVIEDDNGYVNYIERENRTPGCSAAFDRVDSILRNKDLISDGYIGEAKSMLMKASDIIEAIIPVLSKDPGFLLCDRPECKRCILGKEYLRKFLYR